MLSNRLGGIRDKFIVYQLVPGAWTSDFLGSHDVVDKNDPFIDLGEFPSWRGAFDAAYAYASAHPGRL